MRAYLADSTAKSSQDGAAGAAARPPHARTATYPAVFRFLADALSERGGSCEEFEMGICDASSSPG
jgi:hypothetical protein